MKQLSNQYIGTELSNSTMRSEDLIPSFMCFLEAVAEQCEIQKEVKEIQNEVEKLELEELEGYSGPYYKDNDTASWILNEDIWNLINQIAPDHTYFGSHEGDGAAYGFWTSDEALQEALITMIEELEPNAELGDIREMVEEVIELLDTHDR